MYHFKNVNDNIQNRLLRVNMQMSMFSHEYSLVAVKDKCLSTRIIIIDSEHSLDIAVRRKSLNV